MSKLTTDRTLKARLTVRRMRMSLPFAARRAWGLRLQAIKGGRAVQRLYKLRGEHPLVKYNEERRKLKSLKMNEIQKPRSGSTLHLE